MGRLPSNLDKNVQLTFRPRSKPSWRNEHLERERRVFGHLQAA